MWEQTHQSIIVHRRSQLKKERGSLVNKADQPPSFLHHRHQGWEVKWCGAGPCRLSWNMVGRILSGGDDWLMGQWCPTSDQFGLEVGSFCFLTIFQLVGFYYKASWAIFMLMMIESSWVTFRFFLFFSLIYYSPSFLVWKVESNLVVPLSKLFFLFIFCNLHDWTSLYHVMCCPFTQLLSKFPQLFEVKL